MLDEFSTVKLDTKKPAEAETKSAAAPAAAAAEAAKADAPVNPEEMTEEDFAKQLQDGMANLLGELEKSVCTLSFSQACQPCAAADTR